MAQGIANSGLNFFEFHGSVIYDERRKILAEAIFNPNVCRYEHRTDGSFEKEVISKRSWTFVHKHKLYHFLTTHHGQIESFFELNTSKEKCLSGECGVYFEIIPW